MFIAVVTVVSYLLSRFLRLHNLTVLAKALCFQAVLMSRSFVTSFIHLFVWTDIVTMLSHERLEQF